MKHTFFVFFLFLFFTPSAFAQNTDVIINEIMYEPVPDDNYNEWIELYNNGTGSVSLENWKLCDKEILSGYIDRDRDGALYMNASILIPPGGYALITDGGSGTEVYDNFTVSETALALHVDAGTICGRLTNDEGKPIELTDSSGALIEIITYDPSIGASGNGKSLERNSTGWFESLTNGGTPGWENSIITAPEQNETEPAVPETETLVENITENETIPEEIIEEVTETTITEMPLGSAKITILSKPDSMHFGDYAPLHASFFSGDSEFSEARIVAYVFSPHWISRDLSRDEKTIRSAPYSTGVAAAMHNIGTNTTTTALLPIFLKCNEDEKYTEGDYILRVRLYKNDGSWTSVTETDTTLSVLGKNPLCEKEIVCIDVPTECETEEAAPEIKNEEELELLFDIPDVVYPDEPFTANITLKNQGSSTMLIEVYSYLHSHAKLLSYGFDGETWGKMWSSNAVKIELAQNETKNISLRNVVKNTTSLEAHTYKIIVKDMSTSENLKEEIVLVRVEKKPETNKTVVVETAVNLIEDTEEEIQETISGHVITTEPKQSLVKRFFGWLENIF